MKNKALLTLFSLLLLAFPIASGAIGGQSSTTFKLVNLTREIKSYILHQAPGISLYSSENHGLGIRFANTINSEFGFDWGISLENNRDRYLITADPTLTYSLNSRLYILSGINHTFPKYDWGYQIGAGFRSGRQWAFELMHRQINQQYAGLQIRATYYF